MHANAKPWRTLILQSRCGVAASIRARAAGFIFNGSVKINNQPALIINGHFNLSLKFALVRASGLVSVLSLQTRNQRRGSRQTTPSKIQRIFTTPPVEENENGPLSYEEDGLTVAGVSGTSVT